MDSKLTLKLNGKVIEKAKEFAAKKQLSLSRLVENFFDSLTASENNEFEISPFVKSISTGKSVPENVNYKEIRKEYINDLDKKYQ